MTVEFEITGLPAPQGSKSKMPNGAMVESGSAAGRAKLRDWRTACAQVARDIAEENHYDAPVAVTVEFRFPMPKSRPVKVKRQGVAWKQGKPDLDKLQRALGDSLTAGGLVARDELIVAWRSSKVETIGWTGAIVRIEPIHEAAWVWRAS